MARPSMTPIAVRPSAPATVLLAALASVLALPAVGAAQAHPELFVGADAAGRLVLRVDASAPFPLPASRFPGVDGYAEVFPGFSSILPPDSAPDSGGGLVPVDASADLVFVLEGADDGITVWNDHGTGPMRVGEAFSLGHPAFDSHPVWNIAAGAADAADAADAAGRSYALRLLARDLTGRYADSETVAVPFTPDDATEWFACPMACGGGNWSPTAGDCPECGMALKLFSARTYAVSVTREEDADADLPAGLPLALRFRVSSPTGAAMHEFEVVHEKLMHLLVVSDDLSWFAHEHPQIQPDGSFLLDFRFPHGGGFTFFHDFTPPRVGMQVVPVSLDVLGDAPRPAPLVATGERVREVDGYTIELTCRDVLRSLEMQQLSFRIGRDGVPITDLQPFLGTLGHLVVISQDRRRFVHSHPLPPERSAGDPSTAGPEVVFSAQFPAPGLYKAWGQFQHRGHVITAPFVLDVQAPR